MSSPVIVLQVVVDVVGADAVALAVLVEILEQVLPRQVLAALHDGGEPAVAQVDVVLDAVLAAEVEA